MSLEAKNISTGIQTSHSVKVLHKNISFNIQAGELILLAGKNGVGKSIFLKTLAGILPAIEGSLSFNDQQAVPKLFSNSRISYLLATPPQVELMTPLEIVLTGVKNQSWFNTTSKENQKRAEQELDFCDVLHLKDQPFQELSDGEKQKIMLARCLIQNTPVVLLDEPTAFMDYPSKIEFWDKIKTRAKEKETAFVVCTHDIHIALNHVTKIWLLKTNEFVTFNRVSDFNISMLLP